MVVMASYALTAAAFLYTIARAFGAQRAPLGVLLRHGHPTLEAIGLLVIAPIIESLFLIAMIELLRWLHSPVWLQVSCSASISALLHTPWSHALVVAPSWVHYGGRVRDVAARIVEGWFRDHRLHPRAVQFEPSYSDDQLCYAPPHHLTNR